MIIRSQNKKRTTDDLKLNIRIVEYNSTDDMYEIRDSSGNTIGEYSTMEKAVKVLDMIQNKYFEHMTLEQNGAIMGVLERPKVFIMPQDSEV